MRRSATGQPRPKSPSCSVFGAPKVLRWIKSGELAAINLATAAAGRPVWRIGQKALEAFLDARQAQPPAPKARRRSRQRSYKEFV